MASCSARTLVFLSLLFIGADLLAVKTASFTIRVTVLPIFLAWTLMLFSERREFMVERAIALAALLFIGAALLSLPGSYDPFRTFGHVLWVGFSFCVILPLFYSFGTHVDLPSGIHLWFWAFRVQCVLLVVEWAVGLIGGSDDRPHLWFYEPSYVAICLAAYVGAAMYLAANGVGNARWDLVIALLTIALLASATGLMVVGLAIVLTAVLSKRRRWLVVGAGAGGIVAFAAVLGVYFSDTATYKLLFGYIWERETVEVAAIVERGGIRLARALFGIDAFLTHPLFGVGLGADSTYTATVHLPDLAQPFVQPWDELPGSPFLNPFVEAAGTMGVLGVVAVGALVSLSISRFLGIRDVDDANGHIVRAYFVGFFVMFLALQVEGTLLRFYVWSTLGLTLGSAAQYRTSQWHIGERRYDLSADRSHANT